MTKFFISFLSQSYHRPVGSQGLFRPFSNRAASFFDPGLPAGCRPLRLCFCASAPPFEKIHKTDLYSMKPGISPLVFSQKIHGFSVPLWCYRFVTLCFSTQFFPFNFCRFASQVGTGSLFSPGKLDKSGCRVYTDSSFLIGNKSYKLFSLKKTTQGLPPFSGVRPCRSFSGGTL